MRKHAFFHRAMSWQGSQGLLARYRWCWARDLDERNDCTNRVRKTSEELRAPMAGAALLGSLVGSSGGHSKRIREDPFPMSANRRWTGAVYADTDPGRRWFYEW